MVQGKKEYFTKNLRKIWLESQQIQTFQRLACEAALLPPEGAVATTHKSGSAVDPVTFYVSALAKSELCERGAGLLGMTRSTWTTPRGMQRREGGPI